MRIVVDHRPTVPVVEPAKIHLLAADDVRGERILCHELRHYGWRGWDGRVR